MAVEEHKFADVLPCLAPQRHAAWMAVDAVARDVQAPLGDLFNEIERCQLFRLVYNLAYTICLPNNNEVEIPN